MCFRSWVVGPARCPLPQTIPRGSSLTGADQWGSAAPCAPPRRVSRIPLKILQNIVCACVCASVTRPCWKGVCLECLLTFSLVSITHQSRMFIHQAFRSRDTAMFSAGMDGSSQTPRMSLPGPSPESVDHAVPRWIPKELLEHCCQELVAKLRARTLLCQALTDGCGLSFLSTSSPDPLPTAKARIWPAWWDFSDLQHQGRNQTTLTPTWGEESQETVDCLVGAEDLLPTPAWTLPPPCLWDVLRAANSDDLGHVRMWSWNKWVSAVTVWP